MKEMKDIKSVYFVGIGGIGMSALARYFISLGKKVSGYDKTETALTKKLEEEGMIVHYEDDQNLLDKDADIVVYTPAIPKDHTELAFYKEHGYRLLKRSDVLGIITESSFNICVAGTHGKTTTTTMVAYILRETGYGCNAFLGGLAANYNSNFWSNERNVCVIEADEYDRSFLKLSPDVAVITAMDADHLDIYGTAESMEEAFIDFAARIKPGGILFSHFGLKRTNKLKADKHFTYSLNDNQADVYAANIRNEVGGYIYDVKGNGWEIKDMELKMGGLHNIENSVVAVAIAMGLGLSGEKVKAAVAGFKGVKRRFEYIVPVTDEKEVVFIDDYAHHPEELRALITSAKALFPGRKCTVVFQPHLFTRTRDFADGFTEVLGLADEVLLLPIYPARELPIAGVESEMLVHGMRTLVQVVSKEALLGVLEEKLKKNEIEVLITAGAGDIDKLVAPVQALVLNR